MTEARFPDPASTPEARQRARTMFRLGTTGVACLVGFYAFSAVVSDPVHRYQGLGILTLAFVPALLWARSGAGYLPVFEVFVLTTANSYAFPLLNGHTQLLNYPPEAITRSGNVVLFFQILIIGVFLGVGGRPGRSRFFTEEIFSKSFQRFIGYGMVIATIYTYVYYFHPELLPSDIMSVLRAVFYGIGLVSVFAQAQRWGAGELNPRERGLFVFLMTVQVIMHFSTLFLVGGIANLMLALVGYVAGGRRIPVVALVCCLAVIALLHNGKSAMREIYWHADGYREQPTPAQMPAFFSDWVNYGFEVREETGEQELAKKLLDRTSLLHILCLVVSRTPQIDPYLDGETYGHIPGQFVPRFFWPDKPRAHISTYRLGEYYGLQTKEGSTTTTIGFGMLSESYANFGFLGVAGLAVVLGTFYKKVRLAAARSPLISYGGIFLVVLLAWSFQTEMTASIWLSSMAQACVAVLGIPFILRNVAGE